MVGGVGMVELSKRLRRGGLRRRRGFTLIELAIVLVIIGIILGAVLKGQDLIMNARAKKFVSKVKAWEVAQWNIYDRKGRFAGDQGQNGVIGDETGEDVKSDLTAANFINPPYEGSSGSEKNTITMGSSTFYVYFGHDNNSKNVMVLCKDVECSPDLSEHLVFIEALDTSIDGIASGTEGNVVCIDSLNGTPDNGTWIAKINDSIVGCNDTNARAIVYYFDSRRE